MTALSTALSQISESYGAVGEAVDAAFASTDALSANAASQMRSQSDSIDRQIEGYRSLVASLEQVKPSLPADDQPLIDTLITRLNASIELQEQLRDALRSGADGVEAGNTDAQAKHAEIKQLADQASQSLYVKRARQRQAEARRGVERVVADFREPRAAEPTYERGVGGRGYRRSSRDHRI